ncbi:MAG: glycosyltransferase [Planctomycetes bacterium]|nr:glycosyltransferase [Planctomycetota bacterium]
MPALSVILTTYNKPRDLARSLAGMAQQTFRDFELLVCDDGSGPETRALIEGFAARADFPVHHVWQEDAGFRAARSRNNGARRALGETLVFVDGDIIAFPDFLQVHHDAQRPGAFQAGERYLTTEEGGAAIEVAAIEDGSVYAQLPAGERRRLTSLRWKNRFYRVSGLKPERPALMTCNCSLSLELFRAVNGLDERYEGWGQEDEDLRRRLVMQGARPDSLIGKANGLHLWHRADASFRGSRRASPNWAYYERGFHLSRCRRGLVERALSEVRGEVLGGDPVRREALGASLGWAREPERGSPLEVALWIDDGTPTPPWPECEVRVLLSDDPQPRGLSCDLICGPGLPTAGGELPGERFDPVPDAWSGAKALRPVDASDPEAVRATLERIL